MADELKKYPSYYSPEAKKARRDDMLGSVKQIDAGNEELRSINQRVRNRNPTEPIANYAKGGPVGKIGQFGMKRSKPDFAGGGSKTNFKMDTKKGKMPW